MLKLNLGCGTTRLPGWVNVDKHASLGPDQVVDLESFPWPWTDSSVEEVMLSHVLEHLGQTPAAFIGVMKELWRVCSDGARVHIAVPDPRHDFFLDDPTHVRPILRGTLELFSRELNEKWRRMSAANTQLALIHGVDFELEHHEVDFDEPWRSRVKAGGISQDELRDAMRRYANVVVEHRFRLVVVKLDEPAR